MKTMAAVFWSLFLIRGSVPVEAAQDVLTPHQVARIRTVGEAVMAPDGGLIAYTVSVPRAPLVDEDGPSWAELHVASPDGTSRPFVTGKVNVGRLAWTPDGKAISFLARRGADRTTSLYLLVNAGLVDRAKGGITGGSYGGYASAWGATYYSDRFAASVMFVGISDEISKQGSTDIPWEMYYVHLGYWPWDRMWMKTLERSPIYYAGQSHTPTLILGGTDDRRVPPGQSLEMYRHLKLRGKAPVRLVRYPGEQHGNRRAASRLDYCLRMMQWMEHYLTGPGGAPPAFELSYEESGN